MFFESLRCVLSCFTYSSPILGLVQLLVANYDIDPYDQAVRQLMRAMTLVSSSSKSANVNETV